MFKTKKSLIALFMLCFAITTLGAYAALTFHQDISWTWKTEGFTVTANPTVNFGTIGDGTSTPVQQIINYPVSNTGNTAIVVNAVATPTGSCTVAWDKTSASLGAGQSTTFQLTLTISGSGSCAVDFTKA